MRTKKEGETNCFLADGGPVEGGAGGILYSLQFCVRVKFVMNSRIMKGPSQGRIIALWLDRRK